jgi:hypothetical protein
MDLKRFIIIPVVTCSVIGATAFDAYFAENLFHDTDIIISPGFGRIVETGQMHTLTINHLEEDNGELKCKNEYEEHPFQKKGISPAHRITLTDKIELQFTVEANVKDPVVFIQSRDKKIYCLQQRTDQKENLHSTNFLLDGSVILDSSKKVSFDGVIPAGTYLIWVGTPYDYEANYKLTIEEDDH